MTLIGFYKNNDGKRITLLVTALILFVVSIVFECILFGAFDSKVRVSDLEAAYLSKIYYKNFYLFWFASLAAFLLGSWRSFVSSFDAQGTLTVQLIVACTIIFSFLTLGLITLGRLPSTNQGLYSALITVFAVLSASVGWLISAQLSRKHQSNNEEITKHNHRRSHTMNLILSQRLSPEYHQNVSKVKKGYSLHSKCIPKKDVEQYFEQDFQGGELSKDKYEAITASLFLLDLYEFICEGIYQGDLDRNVIYESIGGVLIRCKKRSNHLINAIISGTDDRPAVPKAFCKFLHYVEEWEAKHSAEEAKIRRKETV